jgi:fructokinase
MKGRRRKLRGIVGRVPGRVVRAIRSRPVAQVTGTGLTALDRIYAGCDDTFFKALGGSCGNVLISLAMLGHRVAPIVSLGDDESGAYLFDEMRQAGCITDYIVRKADHRSPVIVEFVDVVDGTHTFSFICPDTRVPLPEYNSIEEDSVNLAKAALEASSAFYADRLSPAILLAMEAACLSGAFVVFEPAAREDEALLARALKLAHIVKLSDDTSGAKICDDDVPSAAVVVRTHGARGLTVSFESSKCFLASVPAPRVVDTCGSGDMVTTGLLHYLLSAGYTRPWSMEAVCAGVRIGQSLAALNCAFGGARGAFHALGPSRIREGLCGDFDELLGDVAGLDPYHGYQQEPR